MGLVEVQKLEHFFISFVFCAVRARPFAAKGVVEVKTRGCFFPLHFCGGATQFFRLVTLSARRGVVIVVEGPFLPSIHDSAHSRT